MKIYNEHLRHVLFLEYFVRIKHLTSPQLYSIPADGFIILVARSLWSEVSIRKKKNVERIHGAISCSTASWSCIPTFSHTSFLRCQASKGTQSKCMSAEIRRHLSCALAGIFL